MLRICLATAEYTPLAKTGGLADVAAGLSRYLAEIGQDVRVFMPLYDTIDHADLDLQPVEFLSNIPVEFSNGTETFSVYTAALEDTNLRVHLIHCPALFDRGSVYDDGGDEHRRFAMLCRAIIQSCQHMGWAPDVFHCNDWHTALIPLYLRTTYEWDQLFENTSTVLTIHNLGYQGLFHADVINELGFDEFRHLLWQEDLTKGMINYLKMGIVYADMVTTVSRTYAQEIQTPAQGCGLEEVLQSRQDHLLGILNGVDDKDWNPATDPLIPANYDQHDLAGKSACKRVLLKELNLPATESAPVIGMVSRLTGQKGFDLLENVLPELLSGVDVRLAILGSGEQRYEDFFAQLQQRFASRVCFYKGYNNKLAHMIEAGSDMFLMPSQFEPCGLNQMYSLKYGTAPIVRKTGGLADTVQHFNPETGEGTGFVFESYDAGGVRWAIAEALRAWKEPASWSKLIQNGMSRDYSWQRQGREYLSLFARLAGK